MIAYIGGPHRFFYFRVCERQVSRLEGFLLTMRVKLSGQKSELLKFSKKYLLPFVADPEPVAGRGRIKAGFLVS